MRDHLSLDQFAKCFVDGPSSLELEHLGECPQCRSELERFGGVVSSFRTAVRDRIDAQLAVEAMSASHDADQSPVGRVPTQRWALVVAVFAGLLLVPVLTMERKAPEVVEGIAVRTDPDALMGAVNLHLLRTVPAPMEPLLKLVPEPTAKSGGIQ